MSKLRTTFLNIVNTFGDNSGCHQMPERSFYIRGRQLPICARCTGVFIGQTSSMIIGIFITPISVISSLVMLCIIGMDWGLQEIEIKESTNFRRFITGILGGYGLFNLCLKVVSKILKKNRKHFESQGI